MSFNKAKVLKSAEKYVQQGKIAAAIDEYRKIVEADPNDLTMINTLGDLCVRAGRTEEAIMNFSRIAENYRENGFTLKAIAMYKKISKLEPSNFETSLKLADLYSKQGLIVDARQQYLQVADSYKRNGQTRRALEVLKKIADLDPENTSVRLKLAESYQMEGMNSEAQEAYVSAGHEFQRKGRQAEAIQAFQKAISINPDSKSALKALIDAYLQQGDTQQALSIINSALDKNPGDTDLLVLLGRTYLTAKMVVEAEGAFTRLLEIDKTRYDYLIETGKKYLERGIFDRVIAVCDKCIDLLIARRQEEKAVSLLKGILEFDPNHIDALHKLAEIYLRVREDYNLASTLNSIVDVALRKGDKSKAIEALKQLAEIEPDEPSHRQRLANLGVSMPVSDYQSSYTQVDEIPLQPLTAPLPAGFNTRPLSVPQTDMQLAEKQLMEAEMFASRGYADHAAELLEDLTEKYPQYIEARLKLRQIYLDGGSYEKAATESLELAKLYEARGEHGAAQQMLQEAYKINPALSGKSPAYAPVPAPFTEQVDTSYEIDLSGSMDTASDQSGLSVVDYQPPQPSYQIQDLFGAPEPAPIPPLPVKAPEPVQPPMSFETLFSPHTTPPAASQPPTQISVKGAVSSQDIGAFEINLDDTTSTGQLARDKILKDELEGIDFYMAQGYVEIAKDTLENLAKQYPNHPAILERLAKLGYGPSIKESVEELPITAIVEERPAPMTQMPDIFGAATPEPVVPSAPVDAAQQASALFDSLLSDVESTLEEMPTSEIMPMAPAVQQKPAAPSTPVQSVTSESDGLDSGLMSIFEEFKSGLEQTEVPDFETHYNLGLAYKDMELYDDAIEEFQTACKATSPSSPDGRYFNCCNMLGFCFLQNNMARPAAVWYKRGLDSPARSEEEYQAMRYDLATAYEKLGEVSKALELLQEVYAIDINYRNVASKIKELKERTK